jgi:hypothetical protein
MADLAAPIAHLNIHAVPAGRAAVTIAAVAPASSPTATFHSITCSSWSNTHVARTQQASSLHGEQVTLRFAP